MPDPFDPALAAGPTRRVPRSLVIDLLAVSHAPDRVADYRRQMDAGVRFPPIAVIALGSRFIIADGHKRAAASRGLAPEELVVELWSARRLLADLLGQAGRFARRAGAAAASLWRGPEARREAAQFLAATAAHWRRMLTSALALRRGAR